MGELNMFTAKDVKLLREKTGCGMMECKKALTESNGDMNAAIDFLRKRGLSVAAKKSGRIAVEGLAVAYVNEENTTGVALEVNSETDFVSNNAEFKSFVKLCADTIMTTNPKTVDELLNVNLEEKGQKIGEILQDKILTIGENIKIRRFQRYDGVVYGYTHAGGKICVLVSFDVNPELIKNEAFNTFSKDIAMQIAATNPKYLSSDDIPTDVLDHEKNILKAQIIKDGKPENIAEKIVTGRMNKFFKEVCLFEQAFVKDDSINIKQYINNISKELGKDINIKSFVRFERGQN